jgi:hypothetical protein
MSLVLGTDGRLDEMQKVRDVVTSAPPKTLYHYTSPRGLIGILTSKKSAQGGPGVLWAGDARNMNDLTERKLVYQRADEVVKKMLEEDNPNKNERDWLQGIRDPRWWNQPWRHIYTCSFSPKEDSVSQWQAYCPPTGGFALGLPGACLRGVGRQQTYSDEVSSWGVGLVPCLYDDDEQRAVVEDVIRYNFREADWKGPGSPAGDLWRDLSEIAPLLKHKSFEHEKEWRLVSAFSTWAPAPRDMHFEAGPRMIKPYYKFSLLPEGTMQRPSLVISVGPTADPEAACHAAESLMEVHEWDGKVVPSATPYRGW